MDELPAASSNLIRVRGDNVNAMPRSKDSTSATLAAGLNYLMEKYGYSEAEVARRSGVASKTVNNMRRARTKATIENADKVAKVFGLSGWQLILPGFPQELLGDKGLASTIKNYSESGPDGRDAIARIAEREAEYTRSKKSG